MTLQEFIDQKTKQLQDLGASRVETSHVGRHHYNMDGSGVSNTMGLCATHISVEGVSQLMLDSTVSSVTYRPLAIDNERQLHVGWDIPEEVDGTPTPEPEDDEAADEPVATEGEEGVDADGSTD